MHLERLAALVLTCALAACGGSTSSNKAASGGTSGLGGSGGTASGGAGAGGTGSGGTSSGGTSSGGTSSGGTSSGGVGGVAGNSGAGGNCPDYASPPPGATLCHSQEDCVDVGETCLAPGAKIDMCGTCMQPIHECDNDAGCQSGFVCVTSNPPCVCTPELSTQCQAKCTETSCAATERCRADGHCEPWPCNEGFSCPNDAACTPGASGADANGCVPIPCTAGYVCPENTRCTPDTPGHGCATLGCTLDSDCDCGACVDGSCAAGPGLCVALPG